MINILFDFKEGPWGGGNQFLKALRDEFKKKGVYQKDIEKADAILFNSFPFRHHEYFDIVSDIKKRNNTLIFHRLDGPISIVRGEGLNVDDIIYKFNELYADGSIFQSRWIKIESEKLGLKINNNYEIIINAPDDTIFYQKTEGNIPASDKIKLIATSWSGNIRKGFDVYKWMDDNLDFSRYAMTFIGNTPVKFNNINHIEPLDSNNLADELRAHHIYVTASKHEPCSNALIEAMHCGLPAIAYDNGGNPEIIGKGGELFKNNEEIINKLDLLSRNYSYYRDNIKLPSITEVAEKYYYFMYHIFKEIKDGVGKSKSISKKDIKTFKDILQSSEHVVKNKKSGIHNIINKLKEIESR